MPWLSDNYKWLFDGVGGAFALAVAVWLLRWRVKRKKSAEDYQNTTQGAKSSTVSLLPTATGTASPALAAGRDIHVNYVAPTSGRPSHLSVLKEPESLTVAPSPNFQFVGAKEKRVFVSPLSQDGICDPRKKKEDDNSVQALVLKFENGVSSDRKIARALNVIAKVRFSCASGGTERVLNYGVWLNSPCNSTDMGIGDTRELVLVCELGDKLVTFEDRREPNHQFYDGFSYLDVGDVDRLEIVDITLIDKNTQTMLKRKFKVWRDGVRFCVSEM